jgi:hypothetical protein
MAFSLYGAAVLAVPVWTFYIGLVLSGDWLSVKFVGQIGVQSSSNTAVHWGRLPQHFALESGGFRWNRAPLQAVDTSLFQRLQALVGGVDVDLYAALAEEDESLQ